MKQILIIGAGKSSYFLIDYLLKNKNEHGWEITICDVHQNVVNNDFPRDSYHFKNIDIENAEERLTLIKDKTLVISMLPAFMHPLVAKDCLNVGVHFASASYQSNEMMEMKNDIEEKGLIFLNECGLDPGIDHMSANEEINRIHDAGGEITSFRSYCGGLIAPECNDNPWGYKFSWNPRNVVLAGQGTAKYLENGRLKLLPYQRVFKKIETIHFDNGLQFEGYPNRDSVSYQSVYGLHAVQHMIRGTLRMPYFCSAWDVLVNLGLTDDSFKISNSSSLTYKTFTEAFLPENDQSTEENFREFFDIDANSKKFELIKWLGIFSDKPVKDQNASPAKILQSLLEEKWKLNHQDRDLVVMQHLFEYQINKKNYRTSSSLYIEGKSAAKTAMAKTVGLPLAIAAKLILTDKIKGSGLMIPTTSDFYIPVLMELKNYDIVFKHQNL